MTPQSAFKLYFGINLHFSSMEYSIIKYGANTRTAQSRFDALTKEQKYRFDWLSGKFQDTQDLLYACIGSQFDNVNAQYGSKDEVLESFYKFKKRREALTYTIQSDVKKHELEDFIPMEKLIFKYLVGKYSPEYVILLNYEQDELLDLYNSPNLTWARENILKLIKYKDFVNSKKFLHLLPNHETATN